MNSKKNSKRTIRKPEGKNKLGYTLVEQNNQ